MKSHIELRSEILRSNYSVIKAAIPTNIKIMSVIKGNAYGHGLREIAQILNPITDWFCVEDADELELLRSVSLKPCLVLGYADFDMINDTNILQTRFSLFSWEQLPIFEELYKKFKRPIKVHIKCDALFGRLGFLQDDILHLCEILKNITYIEVEGIYAHYSSHNQEYTNLTRKQERIFDESCRILRSNSFKNIKSHMCASGGVMYRNDRLQQDTFVRVGALLYGIWPSKKDLDDNPIFSKIEQVMRWHSYVVQVKTLPPDYPVGYDATYRTISSIKIAIIPQGYSDGVDRSLSGKGWVIIGGNACPILGRISMNMTVVDVTTVPNVKVGDDVIILGNQNNISSSAYDLADKAHTISYELVSRVSPLLPRIIV